MIQSLGTVPRVFKPVLWFVLDILNIKPFIHRTDSACTTIPAELETHECNKQINDAFTPSINEEEDLMNSLTTIIDSIHEDSNIGLSSSRLIPELNNSQDNTAQGTLENCDLSINSTLVMRLALGCPWYYSCLPY